MGTTPTEKPPQSGDDHESDAGQPSTRPLESGGWQALDDLFAPQRHEGGSSVPAPGGRGGAVGASRTDKRSRSDDDSDRTTKPGLWAASPPGGPVGSVGWVAVPHQKPGTLGWWNGERFVAFAFWAEDRWEYVTEDWAGSNPLPGALPVGAGDPRESGWWQGPDGRWHAPLPSATPRESGGCAGMIASVAAGFWLLCLMGLIWGIQAMKYHVVVDVTESLPHPSGEDRWGLPVVVGLSCWVAALIAVVARRGPRRRLAIGWALVFAAVAVAGGAIVWAQTPTTTCERPPEVSDTFGVSDMFVWSPHEPVPCGAAQVRAAEAVMDAVDRGAAGLVVMGTAAAVVTVWVAARSRKPLPSSSAHRPSPPG